jgi:hypothetical protein
VLKTTDAGDISVWVECNVPGCAKSTGFKIATVKDVNANIGNWFKHAQNLHPWLLIAADQLKSGNKRSALAAAGGGAAERGAPMLTDEEERDAQVRLVVTAVLSLDFIEGAEFREYRRLHGDESTMSRRTLGRRIEEIELSDVITPRNAIVAGWLRKRPFRVGEVTIHLQAKLHAGTDGWTDKQGRQLESLTLCCGRVIVPGGLPLSGIEQAARRAQCTGPPRRRRRGARQRARGVCSSFHTVKVRARLQTTGNTQPWNTLHYSTAGTTCCCSCSGCSWRQL